MNDAGQSSRAGSGGGGRVDAINSNDSSGGRSNIVGSGSGAIMNYFSATNITTVITEHAATDTGGNDEPPTLLLSLRPRPAVTWDNGVVNNEGLGRKSSKRCCIFHKAREFGESSTESSEDDDHHNGDDSDSSSSGGGGSGAARRPMARKKDDTKKKKKKFPDYQRHHA
jgi:protein phosphatase 1 regulatory subunit 11